MIRPRFFKAAYLIAIALGALSVVGCGPQRVLPTLPATTDLPSNAGLASATVRATGTSTAAPTDTPIVVATFVPTPAPRATLTPTARASATRAPVPTSGTMQIKLFFIAINDNGKTGKRIGCDDSVVAVNRSIPSTSAPLTAAFKELLSIRDQNYGQAGLYNALYQSKLSVSGISITNAKATINLSGAMTLGGVCDNPRVAAQLQELALQFSTVKEVAVFINGVPLEKLLSEK